MAKQIYSLFELREKKWVRISPYAFPKEKAIRLFQNALLAFAFGECNNERRLKPVGHLLDGSWMLRK